MPSLQLKDIHAISVKHGKINHMSGESLIISHFFRFLKDDFSNQCYMQRKIHVINQRLVKILLDITTFPVSITKHGPSSLCNLVPRAFSLVAPFTLYC